ncbi:MAG: NYN domain-containing protein [Myxococcota bacterium]|nr:NYN domain-containing protein [Myxococcota bacterium]
MKRVSLYVDGFNLYFGLRNAHMRRYLWLDLVALGEALLHPDQSLTQAHYFTARIRGNGRNQEDRRRQSTYIDALCANPRVSLYEGQFLAKEKRCRSCGATWTEYEEKMSDVNLAVELLMGAVDDQYDTAIVVSGDSDLAPPIRRVLARYPSKRVLVAFPPRRHSAALKMVSSGSFTIGTDKLRRSLLPERIEVAPGVHVSRPPSWS